MRTKRNIWILTFVLLCGFLIFFCQYGIKDCFWWDCVPKRDFRVLDWELPVLLFPKDAYLSHITPSSEGAGELERGSQTIFWNNDNGIAGYDINRYSTIEDAVREYKFQVKQKIDEKTKNEWTFPKELTFKSQAADETQVLCSTRIIRRCSMITRYQEYIIRFSSSIDDKMTFAKFEKVLIYLDEQISSRLYP